MFGFIQLMQRWLSPAAVEAPAVAEDSSSMADLVRLLKSDGEGADAPTGESPDDAGNSGS